MYILNSFCIHNTKDVEKKVFFFSNIVMQILRVILYTLDLLLVKTGALKQQLVISRDTILIFFCVWRFICLSYLFKNCLKLVTTCKTTAIVSVDVL